MNKELFTPDFLIIPKEVMYLPPADRFIMGAVYFMSRLSLGKCIASNVELGRICGVKAHTVTNSLDRLEEGGLIKRIYKDEEKRNRIEIICLIGFGKLESSGLFKSNPLTSTRVSSTKEHISNTISNNNTSDEVKKPIAEVFNSEQYFRGLLNSKDIVLNIIAYYTLKKGNESLVSNKEQAAAVIARNYKVAKRLSIFEKGKISRAIDECQNTIIGGRPMNYTLETVEKFMLK
jgi:DNA-binding transcriptional regulator YhcF (GntR family)